MKNLFAERLKELIVENGISQKTLSKEIGMSQAIISEWLSGKKQPTAESIYIVATHFQTTADYLLGLEK